MDSPPIDRYLEKMFFARRIVLWSAAAFVATVIISELDQQLQLLTARGEIVLFGLSIPILLLVVLGGSLVVCYYVFRSGLQGVGLGYALGHALLCLILTPLVLLGVIFVPLVVRSDLRRLGATSPCDG